MSVYIGDVQTFAGVIADKPQVLKIGEETMEVFSAWEDYKYAPEFRKEALIAEIADVIQAACNLLAAIGVDDMRQPMQECYVRNKERGREYANDTFSAENDVTAQDVDANDENVTQDSREKLEADIRCCLGFTTKDVFGWLDRQAAITKNECREEHRKRLGELHGLLDEAAREREELAWRVEYNGELVEKVKRERNELQYENDALKGRISQFAAYETTETAENATTKCDIRDLDDSREKLEADVRKCFDPPEQQMLIRWLDRQAAITAIEVARERYDIERDLITARDELQKALNAAAGLWAKADAENRELQAECDELQEQADNQKKAAENFRDMWQKADTRCSELKAENEALKARIESLRSKLSKMLDAASEIQHIGDLP